MATESTVLHLSRDDAGRWLTAEEFATAEYAEPWKYERIDGRLVVMSPKSPQHDDSLETFLDMLLAYKREHKDHVEKVVPECWIRTDTKNDLIPDLAVYIRSDRSAVRRPDRIPELVIEVVSPGRRSEARDYVVKRGAYHQAGVLEYVTVDRFQQTVTVLTRAEAGFSERVLLPRDTDETPLLPGLDIPLRDVFVPIEDEL